jgi:hypothetical protein
VPSGAIDVRCAGQMSKVVREFSQAPPGTVSAFPKSWLCSLWPARLESVSRRSWLQSCCLKFYMAVSQALTQVRTQFESRFCPLLSCSCNHLPCVSRRPSHPAVPDKRGQRDAPRIYVYVAPYMLEEGTVGLPRGSQDHIRLSDYAHRTC